jgi:hypothetical protein
MREIQSKRTLTLVVAPAWFDNTTLVADRAQNDFSPVFSMRFNRFLCRRENRWRSRNILTCITTGEAGFTFA